MENDCPVIPDQDLELAVVTRIPLQTAKGMIWMHTIKPPEKRSHDCRPLCSFCAQEGNCREAVQRGDFVACEKVLRKELLG